MILLKKILWYKESEGYETGHNLTDIISFDTGNGLEIQNNVLSVTLKNPIVSYQDFGGDLGMLPICKHSLDDSSTINIKFSQNDQIKVYLKYSEDGSDYISTEWSSRSDEVPSSDYLIGTYYITDIKVNSNEKRSEIKLICADKTYILFNKILAKTFIKDEGLTTPELVQKIVLLASQASNDTHSENKTIGSAKYVIGAQLEPTGYIQSERSDGTDFPVKTISKVWKPIYEWINDLSQIDYLNSETELSTNELVYDNPFIFYVDENSDFHWFEQSNAIDSNIIVGRTNILNLKLSYSVFDVKNMIIFNAGEDMNKHGILDYQLDLTSNIKGLQMQYLPFVTISKSYLETDYNKFTVKANREEDGEPFPQYPLDTQYSGGLETAWSSDELQDSDGAIGDATSDSTYNSTLRRACKVRGRQRARSILSGLANARWKGSIEVVGQKFQPGHLLEITDTRFGLLKEKLRIHDVKHIVSKDGWFTQIQIKQDEVAITAR